jgi:IclR family acetate operon transcriptional repressor
MRNRSSSYRIGSLERSLEILESIADLQEVSLRALAARLEIPKPTVLRHLRVLEVGGYVAVDRETKNYHLGPRLIYLGYAARQQLGLTDVSMPVMRMLRDRYDETVHVGVLAHGDVLHVAVVPSRQPLKMATPVGDRTLAHISALGKALLAWADREVVDEVLAERGLPRYTERTIIDRAALDGALVAIRERGWAMDDEESAEGLRCVAAPIRDGSGHVAAAISVSAPSTRLTRAAAKKLAPVVVEMADLISRRLGYQGAGSQAEQPVGLVDAAEHGLSSGRHQQLGHARGGPTAPKRR